MDVTSFLPSSITWGNLALALVAVIAGWVGSRYARTGVVALMRRTPGVSETIAEGAGRVVGYLVLLFGIGVALVFLGADVQPLLAMVIVVGVVAVLVLRGVADNFAAGLLIQARRTVAIGDEVQLEGPDGLITGRVTELNGRAVVLLSLDGRTVHVPNAKVLGETLVNDSTHGALRSDVQVRIQRSGAAVDDLAERVAALARETKGVHSREPVRVLLVGVSPERATLRVQFWHHPLHETEVTSAVVRELASGLEQAGVVATVTSGSIAAPLVPPDAG